MQLSHLPPEYQHLAHLAAAQPSQLAMLGPMHLAEEASRQAEAAAQAAASAKVAPTFASGKPCDVSAGMGGGLNEMLETMMKNSVREYLNKELPNIIATYAKSSPPEVPNASSASAPSSFKSLLENQVLQALAQGGGGGAPSPRPSQPSSAGVSPSFAQFSGSWPAWAGNGK